MNARFQSALALALIACILVIVYSPFVDLPLTDTKANHSTVQPFHALLTSTATVVSVAAQPGVASVLRRATPMSTDVVAITCAYLC